VVVKDGENWVGEHEKFFLRFVCVCPRRSRDARFGSGSFAPSSFRSEAKEEREGGFDVVDDNKRPVKTRPVGEEGANEF